jgi:hypothetical protein
MPIKKSTALSKFGGENGNFRRNLLFPNSEWYRSAGCTVAPPNVGPRMDPMVQTRGIMLKALGCSSFCGTSSATMVLMIPTLPLHAPCSDLIARAHGRDFERPKRTLVIMVQVRPINMTGFRPNRSEPRPHAMAVTHWLREKAADVRPAHFAIWSGGTLNDSIISGRYGKTDVKATGSAKRHIAARMGQSSTA